MKFQVAENLFECKHMNSAAHESLNHILVQDKDVHVYMGQPGMSSTDFFNPEKACNSSF